MGCTSVKTSPVQERFQFIRRWQIQEGQLLEIGRIQSETPTTKDDTMTANYYVAPWNVSWCHNYQEVIGEDISHF